MCLIAALKLITATTNIKRHQFDREIGSSSRIVSHQHVLLFDVRIQYVFIGHHCVGSGWKWCVSPGQETHVLGLNVILGFTKTCLRLRYCQYPKSPTNPVWMCALFPVLSGIFHTTLSATRLELPAQLFTEWLTNASVCFWISTSEAVRKFSFFSLKRRLHYTAGKCKVGLQKPCGGKLAVQLHPRWFNKCLDRDKWAALYPGHSFFFWVHHVHSDRT